MTVIWLLRWTRQRPPTTMGRRGSTRIGESLKTFNYERGRRVLGQEAMVLLISDGWDRGDIDLLLREIELNPTRRAENGSPQLDNPQQSIPTNLAGGG